MEDWQEMAIIVIVVLFLMIGYFVYLGTQMMSLKDSVTNLVNVQQSISGIGGSQGSSPVSPLYGILGGFGR